MRTAPCGMTHKMGLRKDVRISSIADDLHLKSGKSAGIQHTRLRELRVDAFYNRGSSLPSQMRNYVIRHA